MLSHSQPLSLVRLRLDPEFKDVPDVECEFSRCQKQLALSPLLSGEKMHVKYGSFCLITGKRQNFNLSLFSPLFLSKPQLSPFFSFKLRDADMEEDTSSHVLSEADFTLAGK